MVSFNKSVPHPGCQVRTWSAGKTLKEQAEILARTHVYVLVHGAALALYMFLPKHAAIIEVSHSWRTCTEPVSRIWSMTAQY